VRAAGGDGGVDSDYDDALAPSEYFAADEKGDAPFGEHGFGPEERSPIYQGEYHGYEGGEWVEMKARPQMLAMGNSIYQETGMAAPRPTKPIVHHPHHPGMHANAMTAEEYEANAKHHKHTYKTLSRQAGTRPFMPAGAMTAAQYEAKVCRSNVNLMSVTINLRGWESSLLRIHVCECTNTPSLSFALSLSHTHTNIQTRAAW
jgi:hypothetical protein